MAEPGLQPELQGGVLPGSVPSREEVIGLYQASRKKLMSEVLRPLQANCEPACVIRGRMPGLLCRGAIRITRSGTCVDHFVPLRLADSIINTNGERPE